MSASAYPVHPRTCEEAEIGSPAAGADTERAVGVAGVTLIADPAGALYWPAEGALVVADLHFEKGSSYARRAG